MTEVTVDFTLTPSSGILGYWIAVSDVDVALHDGEGSIDLPVGTTHRLIWHMSGEPGDYMSITGKIGSRVVVSVGKTIVTSDGEGAGNKPFST